MFGEFPDEVIEPKWRGDTGNAPNIPWGALSTEPVERTEANSPLVRFLRDLERSVVPPDGDFDLEAALAERD